MDFIHFIHLPMKMEQIEGSETSAIRTQTPGNYPKENILHIEHGESLKSRTISFVMSVRLSVRIPLDSHWTDFHQLTFGNFFENLLRNFKFN